MVITQGPRMCNPFGSLQRDFERAFDRAFGNGANATVVGPALNAWEIADGLIVEAELPGVSLADLDIQVLGEELTIKGRRTRTAPENATLVREERPTGEFLRVLRLPFDVEAGKIEATLKDGLLTLRIPKAESARPRKIEVKTQ